VQLLVLSFLFLFRIICLVFLFGNFVLILFMLSGFTRGFFLYFDLAFVFFKSLL